MSETDGIEEAFEGQLRVLVTAAGQIGERVARGREAAMRTAQARSEQEARDLQLRFAAERQAARAQLSPVHRVDWWDQANPHDISHAYQTARAWSQEDPEARRVEQRIRDEVRSRYGIDLANTGADPEAVRHVMERARHHLTTAGEENRRAAHEAAEAQLLMNQADEQKRTADIAREAAEHEPDPHQRPRATTDHNLRADAAHNEGNNLYDSAGRRHDTAQDMEAQGIDGKVVATRMRADVSNGKPATEAVTARNQPRAPKARKRRGRGNQVQRSGLSR